MECNSNFREVKWKSGESVVTMILVWVLFSHAGYFVLLHSEGDVVTLYNWVHLSEGADTDMRFIISIRLYSGKSDNLFKNPWW